MEQKASNLKSNRLGTENIRKLLISMSLPVILSLLVSALYNTVDSIFVGQMSDGSKALAALAISFPLQLLTTAFATGLAIGTMSLV
ncbi:MAG: MATE family efflux transporter, partial [Bacilli bacterium]